MLSLRLFQASVVRGKYEFLYCSVLPNVYLKHWLLFTVDFATVFVEMKSVYWTDLIFLLVLIWIYGRKLSSNYLIIQCESVYFSSMLKCV